MSEHSDAALRVKIRQEVMAELHNLMSSAGAVQAGRAHLIVLDDYEVANLRSALWAAGTASTYQSPLNVLQTGDWTGQILHKLQQLAPDHKPNAEPDVLAARARDWVPR